MTVLFNLSPSGARARLAPHSPWRDVLNESDELVSDVDLEAWGFALFTSVGS